MEGDLTTRRQLERTIVHQAICESAASDHAEFLQRELDEQRRQNVELSRERKALLAEVDALRSDLDEHVELIHRLCDNRAVSRAKWRVAWKMGTLYGEQSIEFRGEWRAEEKRADALQAELNRRQLATESDLRALVALRDEVKRLKSRKRKVKR